MSVELKPTGSATFIGFLLEARSVEDDSIIGSFVTVNNDGKYVNCGNKPQTAVTHVNKDPKSSVQVKWTAPSDFVGSVKIVATFVQSYNTYWVKVPSNDVVAVKTISLSNEENLDDIYPDDIEDVENNGNQQLFCNLILYSTIVYNSIYY